MNVRCPSCARMYRVNPALIPPAGVRARCACSTVLQLSGSGAVAVERVPVAVQPPAAEREVAPLPTPAEPAVRPDAAPAPVAASVEAPATTEPAVAARPRFGSQDPDARARRIARALVSDMVVYNPERRDSALAQGTLRLEFKDEILKSWNEYVEQVGEETARGTPHFRNALNDLLARGEKLF